MESYTARYLFDIYNECRESKTLPAKGTILEQTYFTKEVFDFIDNIVATKRIKDHKKQLAEYKKLNK